MKSISLVVSTLGRTNQLQALLNSLARQDFKDFEVIIVDQNKDDRLTSTVEQSRWPFPIRRVHTPDQRGLSRGRNEGLRHAVGDAVLFPDDDCWYPGWFLGKGLSMLNQHNCACVTGRAADEAGRSINGRFEKAAAWVDRRNVWTTQIEWVAFFSRKALVDICGYDEMVGIGSPSPWGANEGQEITLRLLNAGFHTYYDPDLYGFHAELDTAAADAATIQKGRSYARGFGHVLRKFDYGVLWLGYWMLRPSAGFLLSLARNDRRKARYYLNTAIGRLEGWLGKTLN